MNIEIRDLLYFFQRWKLTHNNQRNRFHSLTFHKTKTQKQTSWDETNEMYKLIPKLCEKYVFKKISFPRIIIFLSSPTGFSRHALTNIEIYKNKIHNDSINVIDSENEFIFVGNFIKEPQATDKGKNKEGRKKNQRKIHRRTGNKLSHPRWYACGAIITYNPAHHIFVLIWLSLLNTNKFLYWIDWGFLWEETVA